MLIIDPSDHAAVLERYREAASVRVLLPMSILIISAG